MTSRYPHSRHDPRSSSSLFENYPGNSDARNRPASGSPARGYGGYSSSGGGIGGPNPYSYSNGKLGPGVNGGPSNSSSDGYRPATPNSKGQYSSSVLDSLESQNATQESILLGKVSQFKTLAVAMGDEIRESSAFAEKLNETFENSQVRLRGTMKRMLRMAEKTGIGWRVWLLFFVAVWAIFAWVWLF
ncbi:MAG: hypothetical protein Q9227_005761 [Pyrenula ochraceoflavens]